MKTMSTLTILMLLALFSVTISTSVSNDPFSALESAFENEISEEDDRLEQHEVSENTRPLTKYMEEYWEKLDDWTNNLRAAEAAFTEEVTIFQNEFKCITVKWDAHVIGVDMLGYLRPLRDIVNTDMWGTCTRRGVAVVDQRVAYYENNCTSVYYDKTVRCEIQNVVLECMFLEYHDVRGSIIVFAAILFRSLVLTFQPWIGPILFIGFVLYVLKLDVMPILVVFEACWDISWIFSITLTLICMARHEKGLRWLLSVTPVEITTC